MCLVEPPHDTTDLVMASRQYLEEGNTKTLPNGSFKYIEIYHSLRIKSTRKLSFAFTGDPKRHIKGTS